MLTVLRNADVQQFCWPTLILRDLPHWRWSKSFQIYQLCFGTYRHHRCKTYNKSGYYSIVGWQKQVPKVSVFALPFQTPVWLNFYLEILIFVPSNVFPLTPLCWVTHAKRAWRDAICLSPKLSINPSSSTGPCCLISYTGKTLWKNCNYFELLKGFLNLAPTRRQTPGPASWPPCTLGKHYDKSKTTLRQLWDSQTNPIRFRKVQKNDKI